MKPHYPLHPLCSIFPEMPDAEFDALRDDIEQHGQRDAIVLWDGQILDGRHRMQACLALGIEPKFRTVEMTWEEAKAYVLSVNLTRRHLDASQRAIIASRLATLQKGVRSDRQICPSSVTQQEAADSLNVGVTQVKKARKVEDAAAAEVVSEVERGKMSLHKAGKLAAAVPDKAEQAEIVRAGRVDEVLRKALPPEEPPQLPKTNTHHTSANRRTPDARETDRIGIVPPDDPRTYHDGNWYEWNEPLNRMISVSEDDILAEADRIRQWRRGLVVAEPVKDTTPVVEPVKQSVSNKRFTPPTADEVASYSDEINAGVDGQQFVDFYESKGWMIGKNKMKDWKAAVRTWKRSENQRGSKITTAVRSNRNWDEEIPEWKPTE